MIRRTPIVLPALTLEQAQQQRRCRLCGGFVIRQHQWIRDPFWYRRYEKLFYPTHVVLNKGKEFAHARCLEWERNDVRD